MGQAVVADVITKGTFRENPFRVNLADKAEIRFRKDRKLPGGLDHVDPAAAEEPGKGDFGHALGERHYRGKGKGWRATDKDIHLERDAQPDSLGMMGGDATMNLIVNADLFVRSVAAA